MATARGHLLLAALLTALASSDQLYQSQHGNRSYFCRDQHGFIGDCYGGSFSAASDFSYGYSTAAPSRKVGNGYFNLIQYTHAELVCDFMRDAGVKDDLSNIVWIKVAEYGDDRFGRGGNYRYSRDYYGDRWNYNLPWHRRYRGDYGSRYYRDDEYRHRYRDDDDDYDYKSRYRYDDYKPRYRDDDDDYDYGSRYRYDDYRPRYRYDNDYGSRFRYADGYIPGYRRDDAYSFRNNYGDDYRPYYTRGDNYRSYRFGDGNGYNYFRGDYRARDGYWRYRNTNSRRTNYSDWYTSNNFQSSTRVFSHGSRSILYIRDFDSSDFGRYRCLATRRSRYPRRRQTIYMDVDFHGRRSANLARQPSAEED